MSSMKDSAQPQNPYERKLKLILDVSLTRYKGKHTPEQYELELTVAKRMLASLGVKP